MMAIRHLPSLRLHRGDSRPSPRPLFPDSVSSSFYAPLANRRKVADPSAYEMQTRPSIFPGGQEEEEEEERSDHDHK